MPRLAKATHGIGRPVPRKEDLRLLTGRGRFASDQLPANPAFAEMVRSPHAHARIVAIRTAAARAAPGVLAVLTGIDRAADGVRKMPHNPQWQGQNDVELKLAPGSTVFVTPPPDPAHSV